MQQHGDQQGSILHCPDRVWLRVVEVHECSGMQCLSAPMRIKLDQPGKTLDRDRSGGSVFLEDSSDGQCQSEDLDVIGSHECHRVSGLSVFGQRRKVDQIAGCCMRNRIGGPIVESGNCAVSVNGRRLVRKNRDLRS